MRIKVGMKYWLHNGKQIKMHELKMQTLIADTWLIHKERLGIIDISAPDN